MKKTNTLDHNKNTNARAELREAAEQTERDLFVKHAKSKLDEALNTYPTYETKEVPYKYKDDDGNDVSASVTVRDIPTNLNALLEVVPADILVKCFVSWNISHTTLSKVRNAKGAITSTLWLPSQTKERSQTVKLKLNTLTPAQIEALKAAGVL